MVRRLFVICWFFSVFSLLTPSFMQASASSGMASRHTTTLSRTLYRTGDSPAQAFYRSFNSRYITRRDARRVREMARSLNMNDWTITHNGMSLAQAFGADKGTFSFPKLDAKLPAAQSGAKQATGQGLPSGDTNPPTAKQEHANFLLGKEMAAAQPYNWTGAQFTALNNVVMAESGWNPKAENPGSGAYGIPQALPGSKMASAGKDWETDPRTQIAWMLEYIRSTYGTPEVAWAHEQAVHWY